MPWQLLIIISVVTFSASVILQRQLLHKHKVEPIAYVVVFQGLVALTIGAYTAVTGFVMPDFSKYWLVILGMTLLFSFGHIMYAKTLQKVEASIFNILFATSAIWVMILSVIIFHEHLSLLNMLGTLLIFASVGLLADRTGKFKLDEGIVMGLFTGVIFGLATMAWVYAGRYSDAASLTMFSFAGVCLTVLVTHPDSVKQMRPIFSKSVLRVMLVLAVLFSASAVALLKAFQVGNASLVAPVQQTSIIVTTLMAIVFLKEKERLWVKLLAAAICFVGVVLIV